MGRPSTQAILNASAAVVGGRLHLASVQSGEYGIPLKLVNGSTLALAGNVASVSPDTADVRGTTVAQLQVADIAPAYLTANYTCLFLRLDKVLELEGSAFEVRAQGSILLRVVGSYSQDVFFLEQHTC